MHDTLTEQSIKKKKPGMCETLTEQSIAKNTKNARDTNVTTYYRRKLRMRNTLT